MKPRWNYKKDGYYERYGNRDQGNCHNKDGFKNNRSGVYVTSGYRDRAGNGSGSSRMENMLVKVLQRMESTDSRVKELKSDLSNMNQLVDSHSTSIKQLEYDMGKLSASLIRERLVHCLVIVFKLKEGWTMHGNDH